MGSHEGHDVRGSLARVMATKDLHGGNVFRSLFHLAVMAIRVFCCYVPTQLFLALYMCIFILVSPVAIFRTGFSLVEYCSGSFRPFLQFDY